MIYPKNSFYTNFIGAYKSNDVEIRRDLIFSQIGILIAKKKKDVIATFKEVGVSLPKNPSDSDIVNAIIKNYSNRRLHIGLAYLIHENNKKEFEQYSGADGEGWKKILALLGGGSGGATAGSTSDLGDEATTTATSAGGSTVGAIAGAIGSIFGYASSVKDAKAQKESDRAAMLQSVMAYKAAKLNAKSGKSNVGWWILGAVLLTGAIIGTVIYFKKKGVKAEGGTVDGGVGTAAPKVEVKPTVETV